MSRRRDPSGAGACCEIAMPSVEDVVNAAVVDLQAVHSARETALETSRGLIRQCANAIRAIHRHEFESAWHMLEAAGVTVGDLRQRLAGHPGILHAGYTQDSFKEYAEARLTYALVHDTPLPTAREINVEASAYLNGMAEAASELRRYILDGLRHGDVDAGERLLAKMDDIYSLLVTVDYPDAVTAGLRRTTDALRAVLERTRGDLTASVRQNQLLAAMATFERAAGLPQQPAPEAADAADD